MQTLPPPADLAPWLDGVVSVRTPAGLASSWFPALPHAMLTVRVHGCVRDLRNPLRPLAAATFHTLSTTPANFLHDGAVHALGLLVKPAAAACLLGPSTGALIDHVLPWAAVAGASEAARLEDEVQAAPGEAQRLAAVLDSFRRALRPTVHAGRRQEIARWCDAAACAGAAASRHLGISERQLERRFRACLGLAPKQFQRLARLHHTLGAAVNGEALGAELALRGGYYDQSHLARELRQLAGAPLRELLAQARPDAPRWALAWARRTLVPHDGLMPPG